MPAVLSKEVERVPWELMSGIAFTSTHVTCVVPISLLRSPTGDMEMPLCSFEEYIQDKGVPLEHVRAAALLVDHCIGRHVEKGSLARHGYDERVITCWIQEEETKGFFKMLAKHAKEVEDAVDPVDDVHRVCKAFKREFRSRRKSGLQSRSLWCWHCRTPTNPGKLCGGCKTARYCSELCQRMDWSLHRLDCRGHPGML